jgi:hypothetical protein
MIDVIGLSRDLLAYIKLRRSRIVTRQPQGLPDQEAS